MTAALALLCLALAAALDVYANLLLKRSDGFRRPWPGVAALGLVLAAFGLLGLSLRAVPLSTAYAVWGGLGIAGTALLSRRLDGLRFRPAAWLGLALILSSVVVLNLSHG
jgi:spermidine export protein MdtI